MFFIITQLAVAVRFADYSALSNYIKSDRLGTQQVIGLSTSGTGSSARQVLADSDQLELLNSEPFYIVANTETSGSCAEAIHLDGYYANTGEDDTYYYYGSQLAITKNSLQPVLLSGSCVYNLNIVQLATYVVSPCSLITKVHLDNQLKGLSNEIAGNAAFEVKGEEIVNKDRKPLYISAPCSLNDILTLRASQNTGSIQKFVTMQNHNNDPVLSVKYSPAAGFLSIETLGTLGPTVKFLEDGNVQLHINEHMCQFGYDSNKWIFYDGYNKIVLDVDNSQLEINGNKLLTAEDDHFKHDSSSTKCTFQHSGSSLVIPMSSTQTIPGVTISKAASGTSNIVNFMQCEIDNIASSCLMYNPVNSQIGTQYSIGDTTGVLAMNSKGELMWNNEKVNTGDIQVETYWTADGDSITTDKTVKAAMQTEDGKNYITADSLHWTTGNSILSNTDEGLIGMSHSVTYDTSRAGDGVYTFEVADSSNAKSANVAVFSCGSNKIKLSVSSTECSIGYFNDGLQRSTLSLLSDGTAKVNNRKILLDGDISKSSVVTSKTSTIDALLSGSYSDIVIEFDDDDFIWSGVMTFKGGSTTINVNDECSITFTENNNDKTTTVSSIGCQYQSTYWKIVQ